MFVQFGLYASGEGGGYRLHFLALLLARTLEQGQGLMGQGPGPRCQGQGLDSQ